MCELKPTGLVFAPALSQIKTTLLVCLTFVLRQDSYYPSENFFLFLQRFFLFLHKKKANQTLIAILI